MMTLGVTDKQGDLFDDVRRFCDEVLAENSIYAVLHRERGRLFPDELFADLFSAQGRRSVPPSVVATVMVLQRLEGLSDREAVERFTFDARWRYAAGVGGYDNGNWEQFAHTVLVDMRARLAGSDDPKRVFNVSVEAASAAGLVGAKRVLDSTPLYDAVATMDTVTLVRSALRGLLRVADGALDAELRAVLGSGDDYASAAKPQIDWDDPEAREALIDSRARDAFACLALLDGRQLGPAVADAAQLLATVVGQDLEETEDGTFRIARRVAKDRVISTVDPEARHGHKTVQRGFDGYKGHVAVDPDSEIITATAVTPGNAGDATAAKGLTGDSAANEGVTAGATTEPTLASRRPSCTATPPTAPASSWPTSPSTMSPHAARSRPRTTATGCSPRTASRSRWSAMPSPAPPASPWPSAVVAAATASPTSPTHAPPVRCAPCAPTPRGAAPSRSRATNSASRVLAPLNATRSGPPTTGPRARRSSASSATSCGAGTAGVGRGCGARARSTPTSTCSPPRRTSRASPR